MNIDFITNRSDLPPAEFLEKITFEFPRVVKYGLIYRCGQDHIEYKFHLEMMLYSSPLPNRSIENSIGNLCLVINRYGHVDYCSVRDH